ncbi:uncharacterized protein LOC113284416 isoform X1 [Papaver somniferum]|uniref:uncharacterized protein LOC113284416 isoform X1 n=1 Tax=Papaver somniferum TaxID=3469 RepID=UPI000E6F7D4B|nr:uncharacterized protein LOC113284416 isoform X1 [Papaver somniferum]
MESPYSPFQLEMLEAACVSSGYSIPPLGIRKRLANDLGLSDAKVRYWFSDRAEKDKDSTSNPCYGSGQRYCGKSTFLSFVSTEYGGVCTTSRREEAAPKLEVSKKQVRKQLGEQIQKERMDAIHKFHERAKEVFASRVAIEVELDHKVFGQTVNVLIQMTLEDIEFICTPYEWLSNNAIVLYIRLLYEKFGSDAHKNKFGSINPAAVNFQVDKEVFVRNILSGLKVSACSRKYIFIPCNTGVHWVLIVFFDGVFYYLNSLDEKHRYNLDEHMSIVSQALARELDFKTSKEKVSWVDVKHNPKQEGTWECGFYVMLYMKQIIKSYDIAMQNPQEMFKSGMKYGMPKIDEVRKEWIDYVSPIIEKY